MHGNRYHLQIERETNITIFIKGIGLCSRAHLHIFWQSSPLHLAHAAQATARSGSHDLQAYLQQCSVPGPCPLKAAPDGPYDEKLRRAAHPGTIPPIIILSRQNAAKLPAGWSDWQLCSMYYDGRKSHMYSGCREKVWGAALFFVGTVNGYFALAEFWVSGRGIRSSSAPCPGGCGTRMRP